MAEDKPNYQKVIDEAVTAAEREILEAEKVSENLFDNQTREATIYSGIRALYEQNRAIIELLKRQTDPLRNY